MSEHRYQYPTVFSTTVLQEIKARHMKVRDGDSLKLFFPDLFQRGKIFQEKSGEG